jgi:hypothetical protein
MDQDPFVYIEIDARRARSETEKHALKRPRTPLRWALRTLPQLLYLVHELQISAGTNEVAGGVARTSH